jgi:hypothetical protein
MNVLTFAHDRVEERAAFLATDIMRFRFTKDKQLILALGDLQLPSLDTCKGLERGSSRSAALGAVAVQRVFELILNGVLDRSTKTATG